MPCTYDESPAEVEARNQKRMEEYAAVLKDKLDTVTDMLCRVLTYAEHRRFTVKGSETVWEAQRALLELHPGLPKWWSDHLNADARRKALEEAKRELKKAQDALKRLQDEVDG